MYSMLRYPPASMLELKKKIAIFTEIDGKILNLPLIFRTMKLINDRYLFHMHKYLEVNIFID